MKAVVIANGALPSLAPFEGLLGGAQMVVAADGGARALLEAGRSPTAIVGDMDSLDASLLEPWRAGGGETLLFAPEKDETDLELALRHVHERGARHIAILGALGGRADHALANLLLLAAPWLDDSTVAILDEQTRIVAVRQDVTLSGEPGDLLSLLPLTTQAIGIQTEGLRYPLRGETLALGTPRGVSNVFVQATATARLEAGILLAVHTWPGHRALNW